MESCSLTCKVGASSYKWSNHVVRVMNISRKSFIQMSMAVAMLGSVGVGPVLADEEAEALVRSMGGGTRAETNTAT